MKHPRIFIDQIFGVETQTKFDVSKVFIYGSWYGETWEDKERGEYWIRLKGAGNEYIELVFPSYKARGIALQNIIPDRPLDIPHEDPNIEKINSNFVKPTTPEFTTKAKVQIAAVVGILGLLGAWLFKSNKKPA